MKTSASSLKLVILGASKVGKSALAVRFLTKRFIGEYSSGSDRSYHTMFRYEDAALRVEIVDCAPGSHKTAALLIDVDAIVIVYSIVDLSSLKTALSILTHLNATLHSSVPILLLGNKTDLVHLRQVSDDDVTLVKLRHNVLHSEVSVAESFGAVDGPMQTLLAEGLERRRLRLALSRKRRVRVLENVSRRLGNVFRRKSLEELFFHKKRKEKTAQTEAEEKTVKNRHSV